MKNEYANDKKNEITLKLREMQKELPVFVTTFLNGISDKTSPSTRLAYAYDLRIFFDYLISETFEFNEMNNQTFGYEQLELVTPEHIEEFIYYLNYYVKNENNNSKTKINKNGELYENKNEKKDKTKEMTNAEAGKSRKLAALRSMFSYLYKKRKIAKNVSELVDFPTRHKKAIIRLEVNEVAKLLDAVESGEKLTKRQQKFHQYTKTRDLALITLLLGTGIRVSECVGIDLDHIDFETNGILIVRKGGDEQVIYFGNEVEKVLLDYIEERAKIAVEKENEKALFLSMQKKRLGVRSVQKLVKKYSKSVVMLKNITPHKFRSTFGTNLYNETDDIFLVAEILGHSDVNTTKKHYVATNEEKRRKAANLVTLRDN